MRKRSSLILTLYLVGIATGARAQGPATLGGEFQVNTYTTDWQMAPAVAVDADGDFVVVWDSHGSSGSDSSMQSVQGQRFDSAGVPVGDEFQVNTYTTNWQGNPAVAADADGDFVVVWESYGSSGSDSSVHSVQGQRFDSAGVPVGDEFQVNTYTTGFQELTAVAADADGNFVVVWRSSDSSGSDSSGSSVQGQRFDSAGVPIGDEFQVNTYTTGSQRSATVAADADGDFVVVWESYGSNGSDSSSTSIQGQRFDPAGAPLGDEFQVNTYTTDFQLRSAVAADADGNFVVVWEIAASSDMTSSSTSIQGQRFDSAGAPLGGEFQVNTLTWDSHVFPAVAADADGDFVAVWQSLSGSDWDVQGQHFDSAGVPTGDEFQVNTYTTNSQSGATVAADADGDFVVVWDSVGSSGSDSSSFSIQGQRFCLPIFADGFESGNTAAWSSSVQ